VNLPPTLPLSGYALVWRDKSGAYMTQKELRTKVTSGLRQILRVGMKRITNAGTVLTICFALCIYASGCNSRDPKAIQLVQVITPSRDSHSSSSDQSQLKAMVRNPMQCNQE